MYEFSFEKFQDAFGPILTCLNTTLYLTFMTFFIGFAIALLLAALSMNKNPAVEAFMKVWLSFFRGTPVLVQLFFFVYGLFPNMPVTRDLPPIWHAIICLSLAYSSFYVRNHTGSHSVSRQRADGSLQVYRNVLFPIDEENYSASGCSLYDSAPVQ